MPAVPDVAARDIAPDTEAGRDRWAGDARAGLPAVVGADLRVPLVTGEWVPYANLDYAASAPALRAAREAVEAALPWYSSVHRGAGFASQVTTWRYERARESLRRFVGGRADDAVVLTRNTTDAMNLLAHALPPDATVVVFASEHHASLLPWRRVVRLAVPDSPERAVAAAECALRDTPDGPRLLCVTAASNVTGELWPLGELAAAARRQRARIAVDAAQLLAHLPVDMADLGIDYLACSGHKLYAPFGAGALIGRADWLGGADPYLYGGGATREVGEDAVRWAEPPERHEAGTPNVLGAVALAAACDTLARVDRVALADHEEALLRRLRRGLAGVPGVRELTTWPGEHPRVGIVSFVVDGHPPAQVAAVLSAEYGIGVRDGKFCAHPFVRHLLGGEGAAVRASIGLGTVAEHVDRLVDALGRLVAEGPRWSYEVRDGRVCPVPDPRLALLS